MALDESVIPRKYSPQPPSPDLPLRVARVRLKVALLAVDEALSGQRSSDGAILALENIALAKAALNRWIDAEVGR
jgi:hypothetical protein